MKLVVVCGSFYLVVACAVLIAGLSLRYDNADLGKDDEDYRAGITLSRMAIIWPFAFIKIVRDKEREAQRDE